MNKSSHASCLVPFKKDRLKPSQDSKPSSCDFVTDCQRRRLLGSYFYVIGISYDKMHFTCIWVNLSGFKMIITSGYIEDMKNTQETAQEKLNLQVLIRILYMSIYRDFMKLDTCLDTSRSIELGDFRI